MLESDLYYLKGFFYSNGKLGLFNVVLHGADVSNNNLQYANVFHQFVASLLSNLTIIE